MDISSCKKFCQKNFWNHETPVLYLRIVRLKKEKSTH